MTHTLTLALEGETITLTGLEAQPVRVQFISESLAAEAMRSAALAAAQQLARSQPPADPADRHD